MLKSIIFVALGSGIGGVLRFGISHLFAHTPPTSFPWGTFTCNLAGCLLLGFFYALAEKYQWLNADVRLMLTVGLCGGFTTFSTFINENALMLKSGHLLLLFLYIVSSLILGFAMIVAGHSLERLI